MHDLIQNEIMQHGWDLIGILQKAGMRFMNVYYGYYGCGVGMLDPPQYFNEWKALLWMAGRYMHMSY